MFFVKIWFLFLNFIDKKESLCFLSRNFVAVAVKKLSGLIGKPGPADAFASFVKQSMGFMIGYQKLCSVSVCFLDFWVWVSTGKKLKNP